MKIWGWRQAIEEADLEPSTKLLLFVMANYMNEHGDWCYPSISKLAKGTGTSRDTVFRHLKKAEDAGFIQKRKRQIEGQQWAANEYKAAMPKTTQGVAPSDGSDDQTGSTVRLKGYDDQTQGVAQSDTNRPKNSPENRPLPPYSPPKAKKSKGKTAKSQLPADFKIPIGWINEALQKFTKLTHAEIISHGEAMVDWAVGKGMVRADWCAVHRNWLRRENTAKANAPPSRLSNKAIDPNQMASEIMQEMGIENNKLEGYR